MCCQITLIFKLIMKRILNRYIYSEEDELGKGTYGCVYKGTDTKTKQFVAIKCIYFHEP